MWVLNDIEIISKAILSFSQTISGQNAIIFIPNVTSVLLGFAHSGDSSSDVTSAEIYELLRSSFELCHQLHHDVTPNEYV